LGEPESPLWGQGKRKAPLGIGGTGKPALGAGQAKSPLWRQAESPLGIGGWGDRCVSSVDQKIYIPGYALGIELTFNLDLVLIMQRKKSTVKDRAKDRILKFFRRLND
jgi:hypothetical protein